MKEDSLTDALLREFLLGKLADADRERMEGLFLTDSAIKERVLALEQDLIDDYLEDSLNDDDKESFISRYAQTGEQRRKLRITGAIQHWAVREAKASHRAAAAISVWSRIGTWLRFKPRFAVPITITLVIAVVLAVVWLNSRDKRWKHLAIEQELAQLNSPASMRELPSQITPFGLRPVSVRSGQPQAEIKVPVETRFVELRLPWIQTERYPMYRAEVRRVGDREAFTIPNLQAESNGRYTIRLRLPAQMLIRGDYQINLTGLSTDGSAKSSEEYSFVVIN